MIVSQYFDMVSSITSSAFLKKGFLYKHLKVCEVFQQWPKISLGSIVLILINRDSANVHPAKNWGVKG